MTQIKQPMQPVVKTPTGTLRFQANEIVRYLLDNGGIDMNHLALKTFPKNDREQFAQLIGYSLSGYGELSYVSTESYNLAERMAKSTQPDDPVSARIAELEQQNSYLREQLQTVRDRLRAPIADLYGIHPDDLSDREDT